MRSVAQGIRSIKGIWILAGIENVQGIGNAVGIWNVRGIRPFEIIWRVVGIGSIEVIGNVQDIGSVGRLGRDWAGRVIWGGWTVLRVCGVCGIRRIWGRRRIGLVRVLFCGSVVDGHQSSELCDCRRCDC